MRLIWLLKWFKCSSGDALEFNGPSGILQLLASRGFGGGILNISNIWKLTCQKFCTWRQLHLQILRLSKSTLLLHRDLKEF
jgi:hypothetical protein